MDEFMQQFIVFILSSLVQFLQTEPIMPLYCLVLLLFVVSIFKGLIN